MKITEHTTVAGRKIRRDRPVLCTVSERLLCTECSKEAIGEEMLPLGLRLCDSCSRAVALIPKTVAKKSYLLSDEDIAGLKHIVRDNPKKETWAKMCLYLLADIEDLAVQKHGSLEVLENTIKENGEKRRKMLERRREKRVREIRKRLNFQKKSEKEEQSRHRHSFAKDTENTLVCECGLKVEYEEI